MENEVLALDVGVLVDVVDSLRIAQRGTALDAVDFIRLAEREFG